MKGKSGRITVTLSQPILDELEKESKSRGLTKSAILTLAMEKYLNLNFDQPPGKRREAD